MPAWRALLHRSPAARCGLRLAEANSPCGTCSQHTPPMARTVVALDYAFPWDRLIARFKFAQAPELAGVLAHTLIGPLAQPLAGHGARPDLVLPVPLSPGACASGATTRPGSWPGGWRRRWICPPSPTACNAGATPRPRARWMPPHGARTCAMPS
jgi:hypothetical protein